jgi:type IV pilus assembly protein PilM
MSFFSPQFTACGLDLSDGVFKLVAMDKKRKGANVKSWHLKKIPEGLMTNGEIQDEKTLALEIKKLISEAHGKITTSFVATALPENKTFVKVLNLKKEKEKLTAVEVRKIIDAELPNYIPLMPEEMNYDFQIISEDKNYLNVLVAAVPKEVMKKYLQTLELAGLKVAALETEAQAITRAVLPQATLLKNKQNLPQYKEPLMLVDLGLLKSSLIIWNKNILQGTVSLNIFGKQIIDEIAAKLKITPEKAAQAVNICGLDPKKGKGEIYKIINNFFEELVLEIKKNKNYFTQEETKTEYNIILTGELSTLLLLKEYLADKLKTRVFLGNPLINLDAQPPEVFRRNVGAFTNAIGLALHYLVNEEI